MGISASGAVLCSGHVTPPRWELPGFSCYWFLWLSWELSGKWGKQLVFFWAPTRETSLSSCLVVTLML